MPTYLIYPLYTATLAFTLLITTPKRAIRELAPFAILVGGVTDVLFVHLYRLARLAEYIHWHPFGLFATPFFPPVAWTIFFIMFFHFIPKRSPYNWMYVFTGSAYAVMFANVLSHLGIIRIYHHRIWTLWPLYLLWFVGATLLYYKIGRKLQPEEHE